MATIISEKLVDKFRARRIMERTGWMNFSDRSRIKRRPLSALIDENNGSWFLLSWTICSANLEIRYYQTASRTGGAARAELRIKN